MLKLSFSLVVLLLFYGPASFGGSPSVAGDYVEVRSNHILGGGCTYSSEAGGDANQAVVAWRINEGELAGLSVVAVILGAGNLQLGYHDREALLFIDNRATPSQHESIKKIFTLRYKALLGAIKKVESAGISFNYEGQQTYHVLVDNQVRVATRSMVESDHEPNCDRMIWYEPFVGDASATLVQTSSHSYNGSDVVVNWCIPNKRSAYVGTFKFTP